MYLPSNSAIKQEKHKLFPLLKTAEVTMEAGAAVNMQKLPTTKKNHVKIQTEFCYKITIIFFDMANEATYNHLVLKNSTRNVQRIPHKH